MADFFKGLASGFATGLRFGEQLRRRRMEDELSRLGPDANVVQGTGLRITAPNGEAVTAVVDPTTGADINEIKRRYEGAGYKVEQLGQPQYAIRAGSYDASVFDTEGAATRAARDYGYGLDTRRADIYEKYGDYEKAQALRENAAKQRMLDQQFGLQKRQFDLQKQQFDMQQKMQQRQLDKLEAQQLADEAVAAYQQFAADSAAARDSGAVRGLVNSIRARTDLTPEEKADALAAVRQYYSPYSAAQLAGTAYTSAYGAPIGLTLKNSMEAQAKAALMTKAGEFINRGDWEGLANFFSNNDVYNNGMAYKFLGKTKDGLLQFASVDESGKFSSPYTVRPEEVLAKLEATIDPSKAIEYAKWVADNEWKNKDYSLRKDQLESTALYQDRLGRAALANAGKDGKSSSDTARLAIEQAKLYARQAAALRNAAIYENDDKVKAALMGRADELDALAQEVYNPAPSPQDIVDTYAALVAKGDMKRADALLKLNPWLKNTTVKSKSPKSSNVVKPRSGSTGRW